MNIIPKHPIKIIFDAIKSFFDDDTTYYAASLSFFTIFAFLPILALIIAVISNFNLFTPYLNELMNYIVENINPTHSQIIANSINLFLSNTNQLGYLGIGYMLFIFTMFFNDYEYIISKIHNINKRPIYISFFIYFIVLLILPILFAGFIYILQFNENDIITTLLSYLAGWLFFIILFKVSVNKKASFKSLLQSSLATMAILTITKNLFVYYIIYNKTYTTIYGSFSTLLFLFVWIYVSWIIYLYGIKLYSTLDENQE